MEILKLLKNNKNTYEFEIIDYEGKPAIIGVNAESEEEARGKVLNIPKPNFVEKAKRSKVSQIKNDCAKAIEKKYWRVERYKTQQELGTETSETEAEYQSLLAELEGHRERSNMLESEIDTIVENDSLTEDQKIEQIKEIQF